MSGINLLYPVMAALVILCRSTPDYCYRYCVGLLLVALFGIGGSISAAVTDALKPEGSDPAVALLGISDRCRHRVLWA